MALITSLQNPKVKYIVTLRERRTRTHEGLFLVEGYEELTLAVASGAKTVELYYCPAFFRDPAQTTLVEQIQRAGGQIVEVSDRVFEKISYRDNPDGLLATLPLPHRTLNEVVLSANPFVVIAESVEKPGNLGAILRTADAAGVDAVISCDPLTDWGNPNVVRASKGALFSVQVADATTPETFAWLRANHIRVIAATPQATTRYDKANLSSPIAIAVGTEKFGLTQSWLDQADEAVAIPMAGKVNSLNVATATALLIYEVVRQRSS